MAFHYFFFDFVNSQHSGHVYTLNALMSLFLMMQAVKQGLSSQVMTLWNNEKIKAAP